MCKTLKNSRKFITISSLEGDRFLHNTLGHRWVRRNPSRPTFSPHCHDSYLTSEVWYPCSYRSRSVLTWGQTLLNLSSVGLNLNLLGPGTFVSTGSVLPLHHGLGSYTSPPRSWVGKIPSSPRNSDSSVTRRLLRCTGVNSPLLSITLNVV